MRIKLPDQHSQHEGKDNQVSNLGVYRNIVCDRSIREATILEIKTGNQVAGLSYLFT